MNRRLHWISVYTFEAMILAACVRRRASSHANDIDLAPPHLFNGLPAHAELAIAESKPVQSSISEVQLSAFWPRMSSRLRLRPIGRPPDTAPPSDRDRSLRWGIQSVPRRV
jgi:hypothetical protein